MTRILIKGGHVVDPSQNLNEVCDVLIVGGKIEKIAKNIAKPKAGKVIEAKGSFVTPGWVDLHVHVREPGREDKETIKTFGRAAAKGGITAACCMPNVGPIADNQTVIEFIVNRAKQDSLVSIFPYGSITKSLASKELTEMADMKDSGMVAVSDDGRDVVNMNLFKQALKYCKTFDIPVVCHNENEDLSRGGVMHEGAVSTYLGLPGAPASAESVAIAAQIILCEEVGFERVHFTHVSSKYSVEVIKQAKKRGLKITADCTPHHLTLTDEECLDYNTQAKVNPPLRSEDHRMALIKGLKEGVFDCIATDHAPHTLIEKYVEFERAAFGISGIETFIPLMMHHFVNTKVLTISELIEKVTINPAQIIGIKKGSLQVGCDADVTIINPKVEKKVDIKDFESKGKNTPFNGQTLRGWPVMTIVAGKIVMNEGKVLA